METIYRDVQVAQLSRKLNIPKSTVSEILNEYVGYLKGKLDNGETVKFLNICYLRVAGKEEKERETLAYVSTEIGRKVNVGSVVVLRVLTSFEEYLISDLQRFYSYSIRGLIRIKLEKNHKGEYKVRTKKSTVYNGKDVYVTTLGSFKRKAEIL